VPAPARPVWALPAWAAPPPVLAGRRKLVGGAVGRRFIGRQLVGGRLVGGQPRGLVGRGLVGQGFLRRRFVGRGFFYRRLFCRRLCGQLVGATDVGVGLLQCRRAILLFLDRTLARELFVLLRRGLGGVRAGDLQLIADLFARALVFDLGRDLALPGGHGLLFLHGRGGNGRLRQPAAIGGEVAALRHHLATRLARIDGLHRVGRRHGQVGAGHQSVHVAGNEGLRVGLQQGNQHLVKRYVRRFVGQRNPPQRIAGAHVHRGRLTRRDRRRQRCRGRRGRRQFGRRRRNRFGQHGRGWRRRRQRHFRRWRRLGQHRCRSGHRRDDLGSLAQSGRIEQHRVFAQDPSTRPAKLEQHVQIGFVDRLRRGDVHDVVARRGRLQVKAQLGERRAKFEIGLLERRLRGQTHLQRRGFVGADRRNFHVGVKRLAQRGVHREPSQTGGTRSGRCKSGHKHERNNRQRKASSGRAQSVPSGNEIHHRSITYRATGNC
jgi:hypothetical protein